MHAERGGLGHGQPVVRPMTGLSQSVARPKGRS